MERFAQAGQCPNVITTRRQFPGSIRCCAIALALLPPSAVPADEQAPSHWAWRPLESKALPLPDDASAVRTPIDAFIFSKLEQHSVQPAPPADPATVLRRVFLDLIGLPPTPAELQAFRADPSDQAYASVVDDLLARPQYGERWGRHWLDVARYAETKGYERDELKNFTWRYRDYVIDSFNRDLPYDRFIAEQLAGDELPDSDVRTQVATTFLSLGTFDTIAADKEVAIYDTLDDIVATTSMAFLGQTVQCARCHDHKFEPITQVDYYRLLAAFEPLEVTGKERQIGSEDEIRNHREADARFNAEIIQPLLAAEEQAWLPLLQRLLRDGVPARKKQRLDAARLQTVLESLATPPNERPANHPLMQRKERDKIRDAVRDIAEQAERDHVWACEERLNEAEARRPQPLLAWIYPERGTTPKPTRVRLRGDVHQQGDTVTFGLPGVLEWGEPPQATATANSSGRRRALAEWITGPGAPLAARVMANRIWQYHFGQGFIPNANNCGVSGGEPSHPELLDWLAGELIAGGWRIKPLHRAIVLSSTYRMSASPADTTSDPDNLLYSRWPMHRLSAEAIRDSVLATSGKLNLEMGGPAIFPPLDNLVVGASSKSDWGQSSESEAARRSIYVFAKRAIPLPELAVLGSPDSSCSCEKRHVSTTAIQSLLMLNGSFMAEQSANLAARLREEAGGEGAAQVQRLFELALSRPPRPAELADAIGYLETAAREDKIDPLASLCLVVLNTNEFVYQN